MRYSAILSCINLVGFAIPLGILISTAAKYDTSISWLAHITDKPVMGNPDLDKSVKYASIDGHDLYMDISPPEKAVAPSGTPVIFLHGGGFVSGTRGQLPVWTAFFNRRGDTVFDVDYRLATPSYQTWDKATEDVASAVAWVGNNAQKYNVDMSKLIIVGSSAGGGLALQVGYAIVNGKAQSYLEGDLAKPSAVVAIYPAQNLTPPWEEDAHFFGTPARQFNTSYLGGSPTDYPEAYNATNPIKHLNSNLPPTIIIAGKNDHLLPYYGQEQLAQALSNTGIINQFVSLPFTDHAFDLFPNGLSAQIAFRQTELFLDKHHK